MVYTCDALQPEQIDYTRWGADIPKYCILEYAMVAMSRSDEIRVKTVKETSAILSRRKAGIAVSLRRTVFQKPTTGAV